MVDNNSKLPGDLSQLSDDELKAAAGGMSVKTETKYTCVECVYWDTGWNFPYKTAMKWQQHLNSPGKENHTYTLEFRDDTSSF